MQVVHTTLACNNRHVYFWQLRQLPTPSSLRAAPTSQICSLKPSMSMPCSTGTCHFYIVECWLLCGPSACVAACLAQACCEPLPDVPQSSSPAFDKPLSYYLLRPCSATGWRPAGGSSRARALTGWKPRHALLPNQARQLTRHQSRRGCGRNGQIRLAEHLRPQNG